jgi:outer membrane protein TolC
MKGKIRLLTIILLGGQLAFAQDSKTTELSLQQCVQIAVKKNINVMTALIDKEKGKARKDEAQASLYPKISMTANMTDNVALPTTLLPASFGALAGTPGKAVAVQMGSNYSSSAMLSLSQVLYNQTALTALKLAQKADQINELGIQKSKEEVGIQVAKMYMLALTTLEQQKLIESNIERGERLKKITQVTVDNGVGKQIDLDRINVNLENTYTQLSNTNAAQEQQMNTIKYLLDMPLDTQIQLTDTVGTELLNNKPVLLSDFSSNVNIQLLESQKQIYSLNRKLINAGYLPSLSLSGQAAYQGLQNKFSTYFSSGSDNKWFPYANFTVTLSVPVFDGFEKRSKARQAEMDTKKTDLTLNNTKEALNLDFRNALNTYTNNKTNVSRQKQNLQLAEKVYKETSLKYKEGMATMSNLLQDETSLNNAQAGYLTALYNFKEAELKIMSLNGEIKNLINS